MIKNIFLTGDRRVGKTYLLNRLIKGTPGVIAGFCTVPVFDNHDRIIGYGIQDYADKWGSAEPNLIGLKQEVGIKPFPDTFEEIGTAILKKSIASKPRLLIMDELGFMENEAVLFQKQVEACLDSDIPVLGVIKAHDNPFLNRIRARSDVLVLEISTVNRDQIYEAIKDMLNKLLA